MAPIASSVNQAITGMQKTTEFAFSASAVNSQTFAIPQVDGVIVTQKVLSDHDVTSAKPLDTLESLIYQMGHVTTI